MLHRIMTKFNVLRVGNSAKGKEKNPADREDKEGKEVGRVIKKTTRVDAFPLDRNPAALLKPQSALHHVIPDIGHPRGHFSHVVCHI